jgi:tetratricopeptide (TPR) repeat protein
MECLEENAIAQFVEGLLDVPLRASVEQHLDRCDRCRRSVSEIAQLYLTSEDDLEPARDSTLADMLDAHLRRGATIGRYVVLDLIGMGGMGVVYAAYDPHLDRKVALKLLRGSSTSSADAHGRLLREAQALGRLSHPNVVSIYDVGTIGGVVFIAMEFVRGLSLRSWVAETKPSLAAIIDVFSDAGRGLAAAHRAGLVHRDFKPDNVMVGDDCRVRVMDFGLACAVDERATSVSDGFDSPTSPVVVTITGAQLGTPAYMAPEQRADGVADARSDQFSFCVSLYEALFGTRPEPSPRLSRGSGIPTRVRRALRRGLAADPDARYASMEELLAAFVPRPLPARVWPFAAALLAMLAATAFALGRRAPATLCRGAEQRLAGVWDDARKRAIESAFTKSGRPFAPDALAGSLAALDEYARAWVGMRTEACEATRVRGDQSDQLLSLRMECLDRQLMGLDALAEVFTRADGVIVEKAIGAARSLTPLSSCADVAALTARVRPPEDADTRKRVEQIRGTLARASALEDAGKLSDGLAIARRAADEASRVSYRPLLAEALFRRGALEMRNGDYNTAERSLLDAVTHAEASRHDELAARIWSTIITVQADQLEKFDEERRSEARAVAAVDRLGGSGRSRFDLLDSIGGVRETEGRYAEAEATQRQAIAIAQKALGPNHPDTVRETAYLGWTLVQQGKYDEALTLLERAAATQLAMLGPRHVDYAETLSAAGTACERRGDHQKAHEYFALALAIDEPALGPTHERVLVDLLHLGENAARRGAPAEGLPLIDRVLATWLKQFGPRHWYVANAETRRALVLGALGRIDEARASYERAMSTYERVFGPAHILVARVLAEMAHLDLLQGKNVAACARFGRALAIDEQSASQDSVDTATAATGVGLCDLATNEPERALVPLERALAIREHHSVMPEKLALTRLALARALWQSGGDRARARQLALQARDGFAAAGRPSERERAQAEDWIGQHPAVVAD